MVSVIPLSDQINNDVAAAGDDAAAAKTSRMLWPFAKMMLSSRNNKTQSVAERLITKAIAWLDEDDGEDGGNSTLSNEIDDDYDYNESREDEDEGDDDEDNYSPKDQEEVIKESRMEEPLVSDSITTASAIIADGNDNNSALLLGKVDNTQQQIMEGDTAVNDDELVAVTSDGQPISDRKDSNKNKPLKNKKPLHKVKNKIQKFKNKKPSHKIKNKIKNKIQKKIR